MEATFEVDGYTIIDKACEDFSARDHEQRPRRSGGIINSEKDGYSPLMMAVNNRFVKTALSLLLVDSDPNLQFRETGETALHMAVASNNVKLVKALLAFNADPDIQNKNNETPLDIAKSLKREQELRYSKTIGGLSYFFSHDHSEEYAANLDDIIKILTECNALRAKTNKYFAKHSTVPEAWSSSDTFLLSMDGGGMRILITAQVLVNIEERMTALSSLPSLRLSSCFDYFAGTSSGGLAACLLAYLKADAFDVRAVTSRLLSIISSTTISDRKERIEESLQQAFSKHRTMADLDPSRRVILTASLAHVIPFELHLMTSYGEARDGHAGPKERKVWEACRISCASPYYSPILYDLKLLDGGLVANNPTLDSMTEIIKQGKRDGKPIKFGLVLSIGTGLLPKAANKHVEFFGTSILSLISPKNIQALESLVTHLRKQTLLTDGQEVNRASTFCDVLGSQYFRVTPPLKEDIGMATTDENTLIEMLYETQMYLFDNPEMIDDIAKCLLSRCL